MLTTEEQAKTKRCHKDMRDCCIGSMCMAWRNAAKGRDRYFVTYEGKPEEEWNWNPTNNRHYEGAKVRIVPSEQPGYCGLAGNPIA